MYYDTPEIFSNKVSEEHKALGIQAKIFVEEELKQAFSIMVKSHKDKTGKYGRYLAEVFYKKVKGGTYFSIGEELKRNKLLKGDVKK
jgi:endonuclease YncB( thermonuclease family)